VPESNAEAPAPPWEVWNDLSRISQLPGDDLVVLRSSYCPSGCRYDRHSEGDSRFLRVVNGEGVIFETQGPGAVTRIWMTQGDGISEPLDPAIRLRVYLDASPDPVVDLSLPELFDGTRPPFLFPLVSDRLSSSGGNVCYVPIAYRGGCRITLVGAEAKKIWFQITAHQLRRDPGLTTFSGQENLYRLSYLLTNAGEDPWPVSAGETFTGTVVLEAEQTQPLLELAGPDVVSKLVLETPRQQWGQLRLQLTFDDHQMVDLPLTELFGIGRAAVGGTRSALLGVTDEDRLYCYLPMPFARQASVSMTLDKDASPTTVTWTIRRQGVTPPAPFGYLGSSTTVVETSTPGIDSPVLTLKGRGKWVGIFAEIGSVGGEDRSYLEGDEQVWIDGAAQPLQHGTGVEDFFGGGFYFRIDSLTPSPFRAGLHGMTYDNVDTQGNATGMYRLMLTDAPTFSSELRVTFEGGPTGQTPIRARVVSWYYLRPPRLRRPDHRLIGANQQRVSHARPHVSAVSLR